MKNEYFCQFICVSFSNMKLYYFEFTTTTGRRFILSAPEAKGSNLKLRVVEIAPHRKYSWEFPITPQELRMAELSRFCRRNLQLNEKNPTLSSRKDMTFESFDKLWSEAGTRQNVAPLTPVRKGAPVHSGVPAAAGPIVCSGPPFVSGAPALLPNGQLVYPCGFVATPAGVVPCY